MNKNYNLERGEIDFLKQVVKLNNKRKKQKINLFDIKNYFCSKGLYSFIRAKTFVKNCSLCKINPAYTFFVNIGGNKFIFLCRSCVLSNYYINSHNEKVICNKNIISWGSAVYEKVRIRTKLYSCSEVKT